MKPNEKPRLTDVFKENPLLMLGLGVVLLIIIVLIVISSVAKNVSKTDGDLAPPDSKAFLVYQKAAYFPTKNIISDGLIRADVAFFARQTMPKLYNPKNPAVIFNVKTVTVSDQTKDISIDGSFDKIKDPIAINVHMLANDRVKVSVKNTKSNTNIDDKLPSTSKENGFIATLPISAPNYTIDYVPYDGSLSVMIGEKSPTQLEEAKQALRDGIGSNDLSGLKIGYIYPTNVDYGDSLQIID